MIADRSGDERDVLDRVIAQLGLDSVRDHDALQNRDGFCDEFAVISDIGQLLGKPSCGLEIQLDLPAPVALPELEGVAVYGTFPLLWRVGCSPSRLDIWLLCHPLLDGRFFPSVLVAQLRSCRRIPEPCAALPFVGAASSVPAARTVEASVVERRQAGMAATLTFAPIREVEERGHDPLRSRRVEISGANEVAKVAVANATPFSFSTGPFVFVVLAAHPYQKDLVHPGNLTSFPRTCRLIFESLRTRTFADLTAAMAGSGVSAFAVIYLRSPGRWAAGPQRKDTRMTTIAATSTHHPVPAVRRSGDQATNFYTSVFKNSRTTDITRYGPGGPRAEGW